MQTIKIQNCTVLKDKFFKIIINGEKHIIPYQFLSINIPDDKPFKIKAKYFWYSSAEYTFEPKENISLQILNNRRMMRWTWLGWFVAYTFGMLVMKVFNNFSYLSIFLIVLIIYEIIRSKRYFVLREVKTNKS